MSRVFAYIMFCLVAKLWVTPPPEGHKIYMRGHEMMGRGSDWSFDGFGPQLLKLTQYEKFRGELPLCVTANWEINVESADFL